MGRFLEVIGWLTIVATIGVAFASLSHVPSFGEGARAARWIIAGWALPCLFGGVVVLTFAAILNELRAIRVATERHLAMALDRERQEKGKLI